MIAEARVTGKVPETYGSLALERCTQEVASLLKELRAQPAASDAAGAVEGLQALPEQLAAAASGDDKALAERAIGDLSRMRVKIDQEMAHP